MKFRSDSQRKAVMAKYRYRTIIYGPEGDIVTYRMTNNKKEAKKIVTKFIKESDIPLSIVEDKNQAEDYGGGYKIDKVYR